MSLLLESKSHSGDCYVWLAALTSPTLTLLFYGLGNYSYQQDFLYYLVNFFWWLMGIAYVAILPVGAVVFVKAKKGCDTCRVAKWIVRVSWLVWLPILFWLFPMVFPILIHLLGGSR